MPDLFLNSGAVISECGKYRPSLWRIWDESLPLYFTIMLNPSKADSEISDPTVTRQMERAKLWGYGGLLVGNAFDFRATDPAVMKSEREPSSPLNDGQLLDMAKRAGIIVCAWGKDGGHMGRAEYVVELLREFDLYALKINQDGSPQHPLYLGYRLTPKLWRGKRHV